jgi:hypothetical protein
VQFEHAAAPEGGVEDVAERDVLRSSGLAARLLGARRRLGSEAVERLRRLKAPFLVVSVECLLECALRLQAERFVFGHGLAERRVLAARPANLAKRLHERLEGRCEIRSQCFLLVRRERDIDGENARQAASLVDDAEDALSDLGAHPTAAQAELVAQAERLLREARLRALPLRDYDLAYDRLETAILLLSDVQEWREQPVGIHPWMRAAIENARAGLAPYLAPPPLIPWRRAEVDPERSFPTFSEYIQIKRLENPEEITQALDDWFTEQAEDAS